MTSTTPFGATRRNTSGPDYQEKVKDTICEIVPTMPLLKKKMICTLSTTKSLLHVGTVCFWIVQGTRPNKKEYFKSPSAGKVSCFPSKLDQRITGVCWRLLSSIQFSWNLNMNRNNCSLAQIAIDAVDIYCNDLQGHSFLNIYINVQVLVFRGIYICRNSIRNGTGQVKPICTFSSTGPRYIDTRSA